MDEPLPSELQTLTGIGKTILRERRNLWKLGLIHSDDQPNIYGTTLSQQMEVLQRRAQTELRRGHAG